MLRRIGSPNTPLRRETPPPSRVEPVSPEFPGPLRDVEPGSLTSPVPRRR
jgi:hypothetical protein